MNPFCGQYILDENNKPVPEPDTKKWATWFERSRGNRHVGLYYFGKIKVSTVFLGLDHSFNDGPPVLWETMVFGGVYNDYQERYTSHEEALRGHNKACRMVAWGFYMGWFEVSLQWLKRVVWTRFVL